MDEIKRREACAPPSRRFYAAPLALQPEAIFIAITLTTGN
jgi:hypothetical protein